MENNATPIDIKSSDNFLLYLDNKQFIIEISLNQGKINIQAVNNIGNIIINYESSYSYEDFMKINDYFKPCKETEKIYHFIIKLKTVNFFHYLMKIILYIYVYIYQNQ